MRFTNVMTNGPVPPTEGFGSQYLEILASLSVSELLNKEFIYTPFVEMCHNYDNDPEFLNKKEWLINLIDHFPINRDLQFQRSFSCTGCFFRKNLETCCKTRNFTRAKDLFYSNKIRTNYFSSNAKHIAIHIRRPNPHDQDIPMQASDELFNNLIDQLRIDYRSTPTLFHIYSQGSLKKFQKAFQGEDIRLHINESVEDTFTSMVLADGLLQYGSGLSFLAACLSNGNNYAIYREGTPVLPHWEKIELEKLA